MYHPHLFFREIIIFKLEFPIPRRKALSEWCLKFTLFTKHFDSLYVMNFFMIIIIIIIVIMIFVIVECHIHASGPCMRKHAGR